MNARPLHAICAAMAKDYREEAQEFYRMAVFSNSFKAIPEPSVKTKAKVRPDYLRVVK